MNINYVSYFKFTENDNACFYAKFLGNIKFRIKTNLRGYNKCLTAIFWGRGDSHDDYKQNITHGTIYFHLMYNKELSEDNDARRAATIAKEQQRLKFLWVGQTARSRSNYGTMWKVLPERIHMCNMKAPSLLLSK